MPLTGPNGYGRVSVLFEEFIRSSFRTCCLLGLFFVDQSSGHWRLRVTMSKTSFVTLSLNTATIYYFVRIGQKGPARFCSLDLIGQQRY